MQSGNCNQAGRLILVNRKSTNPNQRVHANICLPGGLDDVVAVKTRSKSAYMRIEDRTH